MKQPKQSNKSQLPKTEGVRFLSDQPLDADKEREMRFGHPGIVGSLETMVLKCPTPFTIGLFGKWGSGKTTILDALERKFRGTETAVVKIDAWKHEGDALRRTFLQDTLNQLREKKEGKQYLSSEVELSKNLRVPVSRTFRSSIKFNWRLIWVPFTIILATLISVGLLIHVFLPNALGTYISTLVGGGIIVGILLWLLQQSVTTETTTATIDRFQDPEEFETEFREKITNQVMAKKLLVIIDNLDRVSCEKAVELLSIVKTFLEQKKCVFLIACDAEAIKKYLASIYVPSSWNLESSSQFDSEEFLRKFFNGYLIIREFIDTELQSYTEYLLKETNCSALDSPDVAFVITKAFRDNPRQIKQSINTLLAHFLLAKAREASGELPEGSVTGKVAYLAKDLIIRQQFQEYYGGYLAEKSSEATDQKNRKYRDFLRATETIDVEDKRPFYYLKLSEEEIEIPGINDLQLAMQDKEIDRVKEIIKVFWDDSQRQAKFNRVVSSFINRNKGRGILLCNIVLSALSALQQLGIRLNKHFYHQIAELLNDDTELGTRLDNFDPSLIFNEVLSQCSKSQRDGIIQRYTSLFSNPEHITNAAYYDREKYIKVLLKEFLNHKDWLDTERKQEIRNALAQKHCDYETLSIFMGKTEEQKEFINQETRSKFITDISTDDVEVPETLRLKVGFLLDLGANMTEKNLTEIVTQFTGLLQAETAKPYRDEKQNLLACVDDCINIFGERIANLNGNIIAPFVNAVLNGMNAAGPLAQKRIFVPVCLRLVGMLTEPLKSQTNSALNPFFQSANSDDLEFVFDKLKTKSKKEELIGKYSSIFKGRTIGDQGIFDLLYPLASKDTRTEWLVSLIKTDHQRAITKLEQLGYRVGDKKAVVSAMLTKVGQLPLPQKEGLYNICNKMECAKDAEMKEKLASCIKAHLKDPAPDSQKMGLTVLQDATYLSQTQKRDIATETIGWLSTQQPDSAFRPSSVQSVLVNWSILHRTPQQNFLYFVFTNLIRHGINTQSIDLGFSTISKIEPKLGFTQKEDLAYVEDILDRAESESDLEIKSHLVEGLKNLKPDKETKLNRAFWRKVEALKLPEKE